MGRPYYLHGRYAYLTRGPYSDDCRKIYLHNITQYLVSSDLRKGYCLNVQDHLPRFQSKMSHFPRTTWINLRTVQNSKASHSLHYVTQNSVRFSSNRGLGRGHPNLPNQPALISLKITWRQTKPRSSGFVLYQKRAGIN